MIITIRPAKTWRLFYDNAFAGHANITTPFVASYSNHVYHQYTLVLNGVDRDGLHSYLTEQSVPSMIYYPVPGHRQPMFASLDLPQYDLSTTDWLTERVISVPVHTEMDDEQLTYITSHVLNYLKK